jgi:predicted RNA-binding protein YlxR (DUF448 family)
VFLRSITIWTIWVARNGNIFNHERWSRTKIEGTMWTSLKDYGRAAWVHMQKRKFKTEAARAEALDNFMAIWTPHKYLYSQVENRVQWN